MNQQLPLEQLCRSCGEPLTLLELREMQCESCEDAQRERDRQASLESHLEDVAEEIEMDRREFGR